MSSTFNISPIRRNTKSVQKEEIIDEIEHLILNPFGQIPKIAFENIKVGSTAKRIIILHNPSKICIEVSFSKLTPEERQLNLNWHHKEIPPESQLELEITWSPTKSGGWRDTIVLEDRSGRIRKNIPIAFKAISPPKKATNKKKVPLKFVIKKKSPLKLNKPSPKKFLTPKKISSPKRNVTLESTSRWQSVLQMLPMGSRHGELERRTYSINRSPENRDYDEQFDDSLEMHKSPSQTSHVLKDITNPRNDYAIPNIKVTAPQITSTAIKDKNNATYNILNLSSLTNIHGSNEILSVNNVTYSNGASSMPVSPIMGLRRANNKENVDIQLHGEIMKETSNFNSKINYLRRKSSSLTSISSDRKFSSAILTHLSTVHNPFTNMNVLCDPSWVRLQENNFKKWLNSLLTPPEDLITDANLTIDIGRIWEESSRKMYVPDAPTKEMVSNRYNTRAKLDSLRNRAIILFNSYDMFGVLSKLSNIIENNKLEIRRDKNIHADLQLRNKILSLFFCYNPLWLRIGLETVYGKTIPLKSNSDVYGLGKFIILNFFCDHSSQKFKTMFDEKLSKNLKKKMLKSFLTLIYFLDQAKQRKLILHDPCLFSKNAPFKESRDIFIQFSKETISGIGDITKYLHPIGYILQYKQCYIEEYDFAVINLYADLKNGVVLARVMEIILLTEGITKLLRVPSISRLQKVHNVKLTFDALVKSNFTISGGVEPKDIVAGEKDKVLSFLWQIINQFQVPRLNKAATIIQNWFRGLAMNIKRRILIKKRQRKENATITIQRWYRRRNMASKLERTANLYRLYKIQMKFDNATVIIQSFWRMYIERNRYQSILHSVRMIQRNARRMLVQRDIEQKKKAIITIQANVRCFVARRKYLCLKQAALTIANAFISYKLMRKERDAFITLKSTVIFLQQKFRSSREVNVERQKFLSMRCATIVIQRNYRNWILMRNVRNDYVSLRKAAIVIQRRYRGKLATRCDRNSFLRKKRAVKVIETYFLNYKLSIKERHNFILLKSITIKLQRSYRSKKLMPIERQRYLKLRKAAIFTQRRYRAKQLSILHRNHYLKLKTSTILIQRTWKQILARRIMIKERDINAAIKIQTIFRGYITRKRTLATVSNIRERLKRVNANAKIENSLAARLENGFKILNSMGSIIIIKMGLEELETVTRLSKKSCKIVCEKYAIYLFSIAEDTIKSLPEQQVCSVAIKILINISKHSEELLRKLWEHDDLTRFFNLMVYYSDKDCDVFPLSCTLIWLYAHIEEHIENILSNEVLKTKLNIMYRRCFRKHKMLKNINKSTKTYFYDYKNLELPFERSTWGLENNRPNAFENSLHSIMSLFEILKFKIV